ncbi:type IV secretory system conjugative DNA transfer family protein [Thermodesulfobacteriota bacterium]
MTVEQALIAQARPYMMAARQQAILRNEISKGCNPEIFSVPVALEPYYHPISRISELLSVETQGDFTPEDPPAPDDLVRLQIWLSPEGKFNWLNSELFIKQLRSVSRRVGFEIIGNNKKIQMQFLVFRCDQPIIMAAFRGQFEHGELSVASDNPFSKISCDSWDGVKFIDCVPPPPYSHLLTRPDELKVSTYQSLIASLMDIESPALGFYQALFEPVMIEHNWFRNIQVLLDMEYAIKLQTDMQLPQRYHQQAPSGDLKQMAWEVETKAHNDKPFFSLALRLGVISSKKSSFPYLKSLETFLNLFQHGGQALRYVTDGDYKRILSTGKIMEMFDRGLTYRPGFLVNSAEMTGPVHIPPAKILENRLPPITLLETLPVRNTDIYEGTPIGKCEYAGVEYPVCIPLCLRSRSTHIIGRPGQTKSTTMALMALDDIEKEMGVAVLDPHGDLIESLLRLIKKKHIEKIVYFDPGHHEYVPIWNPLKRSPGQDLSRTSDDLVAALKTVVTGWGDRMEHLLRHGLYALLHLPGSTLLDLSNLLRRKTDESERLRKEILELVDNQTAYQFWENDFHRYSNEAFDPPKHKLSKLLVSETVALMLSQPESLIDFRQIMDDGKILLVNLSTIGSEVREILGCFMLSLFHLTALSRSDLPPDKRKQFHIYVDEAHRFITDAMEDLIAETRKFGVSVTLAHHYFSQFGNKKIDALSSVGSTIIMNVDGKDARYLSKDLRNQVHYEDMIDLKFGQAIARIGTDIVRLKTLGPLEFHKTDFRDDIIQRSLNLYYRPVHAVRKFIHAKFSNNNSSLTLPLTGDKNVEEFKYDEF